jgi:hypothetical protein
VPLAIVLMIAGTVAAFTAVRPSQPARGD